MVSAVGYRNKTIPSLAILADIWGLEKESDIDTHGFILRGAQGKTEVNGEGTAGCRRDWWRGGGGEERRKEP